MIPKNDFGIVVRNNNAKEILNFLIKCGFENFLNFKGRTDNRDYYAIKQDSSLINAYSYNPTSQTFTLEEFKKLYDEEVNKFPKDNFAVLVENGNGREIIDFLVKNGFNNDNNMNGILYDDLTYYVSKNSKTINCRDSQHNKHITNIYTLTQLKKLKMNNEKISGYKAPYNMFNDQVRTGDIFIKDPGLTPRRVYFPIGRSNLTLPPEIVEQWEPYYEEEFKVDDWVYIISVPQETKEVKGLIGQITDKDATKGFVYTTSGSIKVKIGNNIWAINSSAYVVELRKATQEEIESITNIEFNGYQAEFAPTYVKFGCCKFEISDVRALDRILSESKFDKKFTIDGKEVAADFLKRILNRFK